MSAHLDEAALEALAHGRGDLVPAEQRAHADACGPCALAVQEARALSHALGPVLASATPEPLADLDALVRSVVAAAPARVPAPRASRRSLVLGVLMALPVAIGLGLWSAAGGAGVGAVLDAARDAWTVGFTFARLAAVHVSPVALATTAAAGAAMVCMLTAAMRALMRGPRLEVVR